MRLQVRHPKAAALILAAAAAGGAAYYWFELRPVTGASDLVHYLPPSDSPLLYIDVATLRRAGILDALAGAKPQVEAEYADFVSQTKFDYRRDLDAAMVSLQHGSNYMVISGRFDWKALARYAGTHGGTCVNELCRVPSSQTGKQISFYPLRRNLMALAAGDDGWAASLITAHAQTPGLSFPSEPAWLLLSGAAIRKDSLPAGTRAFASALEGAESLSIALGRGDGRYQALLRVTCRSADDAVKLAGQLKGATATLRTLIAREKQAPNPNDLSGVLTSGEFRQEDRRVTGTWPVPEALLRNLTEGAL